MPRPYEDDDDEKKSSLPDDLVETQDRWAPKGAAKPAGTYRGGGAPPPAAGKPPAAAGPPHTMGKEDIREELGIGPETGYFTPPERGHGGRYENYNTVKNPTWGILKSGVDDIEGGEIQSGLHKLYTGALEFLRPTAPVIAAAEPLAFARGTLQAYGAGKIAEHALPAITGGRLTPELSEDIGQVAGFLPKGPRVGPLKTAETRSRLGFRDPRYSSEPLETMRPDEEAPRGGGAPPPAGPGGLPGPGAPVPPEETLPRTLPRTTEIFDRIAMERYGRTYDKLSPDEKVTVARLVGEGGPGGVERRVTPGEGPVMERRAGALPAISRAGEAGAGATPPATPPIAPPGRPGEEPPPPGTLPRTTLPPAPPPQTLGGPRRGEPSAEAKPPPVDPLKEEFPNPRVRQLARVNGPEIVRAAYDQPEVLEAVHGLSNVEIRQAAITAGIDLGTKHVGSRMNLGPEQVSRQDLIDQMIKQGVKAEDIPRLAGREQVPYTKPMAIPERNKNTRFGVTDQFIHYHELAHAIIAGLHNFNPLEIASHRYPGALKHISASVLFDFGQFKTGGQFDPVKLSGGVGEKFLEVLAGGQAAGEVLNGMAKDANFTASGDKNMAGDFLKAMGIPKYRWVEFWDAAYDRAKAKLTPEVVEIIKDEATRREDNLPAIYHYSKERVAHIVERVRDATEQTTRTGTPGYAGAVSEEAYRSGQQTLPFEESRTPEGPVRPTGAQTLKPFRNPAYTYKFEVFDNTQPGPHEIELKAVGRKEAWKKLDEEIRRRAGPTGAPGYFQAKMLSEGRPEVGPPVQLPATPRGSTTGLFKKPMEVGEKPTVADFVEAMRQRNKAAGLKPVIAADHPEVALGRALKIGEAELDFQRMRPNSGEEWYNQDAKRYDNALQKYHEAMKDPVKLTIAKAIQAGMSLGNKSIPAVTNTLDAIDAWQKTGRIPINNPATKGAWPNGQYNVYIHGFKRLQRLIDEKTEAGAGQWLMDKHPVSELRKYANVKGKATDTQYGAMVLGPKFGPFFLNNMGIAEALTTDMWFNRTWNRWMGTPFQSIMKDGKRIQKVMEQVRPGDERSIMEEFAATLAKKKNLEVKQVQAILWNYEQALYKLHGFQNAEQPSYGEAAESLVGERIRQRNAQAGAGTPRAGKDAGTGRSPRRLPRSP